MPTDPLGGFEDPSDPGFKLARGRDGGAGGRSAPPVSPPPGVVGGGYGSFFGSPTAGVTTFSSAPRTRRDPYAGVPGFKPWMALPDDTSLPVSDTVPAMMRPGEGVLTPEAMSGLGISPAILTLLNQIGSVQHFALGGVVRPQSFMHRFATPSPATTVGASVTRPAAAPTGVASMLGNSGMFGSTHNNTGLGLPATGVGSAPAPGGGSQWAPQGWNPSGDPTLGLTDWTGSGGDQSRTLNQLYQLLAQYAGTGAFSPGGSAASMNIVRENALGNADAARARAGTLSVLSGADPASRANYMLQTDLAGQGGAAKAVNDAVTQRALAQEDFGRQLLSMLGQFNMQDWSAERSGDISKRYAPDQPSGLDQLLGIGGQALGGYLGAGGFGRNQRAA